MCHREIPDGMADPSASQREALVGLRGGEQMPSLHVGDENAPTVLLVGDVFGRSAFYERLAAVIAVAGFQVLLPDFFFRQGHLSEQTKEAAFERRGRLDEATAVDDLGSAIDWLRSAGPTLTVGTIGFCMGGTFVLDLACLHDDLVTVAYYGFPIPQASLVSPPPKPMDLVHELRGPVLAVWGEEDDTVGRDNIHRYIESATEANSEFAAEVVPGLGHGFLAQADLTGNDAGGATWLRALAHLADHLYTKEAR